MATNMSQMLVAFLAILAALDPVKSTTHWVVTEDGMITQQLDSAFNMKEPYSLLAVLEQERRTEEVLRLQRDLERHKKEIEANEDDTDMEEKFLRSDSDCVEAGRPLTEFELYVSTAISLENKGISVTEYLSIKVNESKKFLRPNCTRVFDLPFSMHAYDHLQSVQERHNLSNHPEPELSYLLPQQDTLENIGHLLSKALSKNKTSWVLYDIAGYFWRIKGNSKEVIECSRRALHFSKQKDKNIALLNMANVLHRSHQSSDAAILVQSAMESGEDMEVLYFMLGNVLAEKGDYNKSAECFAQTAQRNPNLGAAHFRKHAVLCHQKLKAALEAQHISVQKALVELQDYQRKQQHFHEIEQRVLTCQKKPDEQFEANLSYQRQRFLQEMGENPHCEVSELGSGAQFLMCRREAVTESGIFGIPTDEEVEIEVSDTSLIQNNCLSALKGELTCFNVSNEIPLADRLSARLASEDDVGENPAWLQDDWPTWSYCETVGFDLPDWQLVGQMFRVPTRDTEDLAMVLQRPFGEIADIPLGKPFCTDPDIMNGRETAMDFVDGISQRALLPNSRKRMDYKIALKPFCNAVDLRIRELGQRVAVAINEHKHSTSQWMMYNLAALYWKELDNNAQAIECLRPALVFAPVEDANIPLVNAALVMMSIGKSLDALQLLRMALVVNSSEPFIHFSLGNAWSSLDSYQQAIQEYTTSMNLNPKSKETLDILGKLKCHLKATENGGPKYHDEVSEETADGVPRPLRSTDDGNVQRESRTICYHVDGKEQCQKITVNLKQIPSSGTIPSSAYGPHIPSVPAPDVDIAKILQEKHLSWPLPEECQHFRRLNLRAFYSTWLAVTAKNIRIEDHIDFSAVLPNEVLSPECPQDFPSSLHTMDHLMGMKRRRSLDYAAEQGLREVLQNIYGDPISSQEAGTRIAMALEKNPDSWVVSNMAALYWRVEGSASKALDCLRHALHFSPNDWKDIALISTANVYHRAGLLDDGITVAKMAVDIAPLLVINHFTLANLYSAKGLFDKAIDLYESSLRLQPEFQPAMERLKTIQCNILQLAEKEGTLPPNRAEN
ncbi:tetratricopeptide repeat protein 17-like isoform X2 [Apostichopus japonicus]|uniref:tetratricopeptide repeat protein 17-like isoform X2 n=1 Tax=Stichopus japonicus TaxID=307972 RepID=UPI003AB6150A